MKPTKAQIESLADMNAIIREMKIGTADSHAVATNHNEFKMGNMAWLAAALCACCVLVMFAALIVIGIEFNREDRDLDRLSAQIRDNQAWVGVYGNKISALEAKVGDRK